MSSDHSRTMNHGGALAKGQGVSALIRDWMRLAARFAVGRLLLWRERASQRRHLEAMSDHMLKDIGLTRADVDAECRKTFWQP